jgi:hypothetical protein
MVEKKAVSMPSKNEDVDTDSLFAELGI